MPAFAEGSFGKKGCPVTCGFYDKEMDYAKVNLPNAEHVCANEQLTIPQHYFVYGENVERFSKGFRKVYENLKELA